jgi:hypothetical protein
MSWLILGVIFTVITYLSWRGTVIAVYHYYDKVNEAMVPLWFGIIIAIFYLLPVFNIILFIAYHIFFTFLASRKISSWNYEYWVIELSDKNVFHKIFKKVMRFLAKPI